MGLRERKKEQTRQSIAETAWRLFAERGYDRVSVAEIARAAEVAEATVFNYFPTKEDLFYSRLEAFGDQLVEAIGARPPGEPALAAFGRFMLDSGGWLRQAEAGDTAAMDRLRTVNRLIAASPDLQAREQLAIARSTRALADLLADQTGAGPDDIAPKVAANALMGVHRALLDEVRRRVLAGEEPARLAADIRALTRQALALLEHGLGDYGAGSPPSR
ncbi:MAG TPA: TetR family transcriptional regulator [Actinomycetota bacterium]|nr:TetR family transcriptional regulator [Actinomycetota bacterium]